MKKTNLLFFLILFCSSICAAENDPNEKIKEEVTTRLNQWPESFNAKNREDACGLFAPDLIASFPGSKDRDYEGMCETLTKAFNSTTRILTYEKPLIEEIIPQGDICVVRLIWTLNIADSNGKVLETVKEKGLDVFQRQKDGSWKIRISYAYPL
jgi:ketosteroid isomerase-like protein